MKILSLHIFFILYYCDAVIGSDVIYCEAAVNDLLITLKQLCGSHTTILLAGELRNGRLSHLHFFLFYIFAHCLFVLLAKFPSTDPIIPNPCTKAREDNKLMNEQINAQVNNI